MQGPLVFRGHSIQSGPSCRAHYADILVVGKESHPPPAPPPGRPSQASRGRQLQPSLRERDASASPAWVRRWEENHHAQHLGSTYGAPDTRMLYAHFRRPSNEAPPLSLFDDHRPAGGSWSWTQPPQSILTFALQMWVWGSHFDMCSRDSCHPVPGQSEGTSLSLGPSQSSSETGDGLSHG